MSIDLVEKIMRHSGYLGQYIQIPDMEKQFHAGEAALYITRADHRVQGNKLDALQRENAALEARLKAIEESAITSNKIKQIIRENPEKVLAELLKIYAERKNKV